MYSLVFVQGQTNRRTDTKQMNTITIPLALLFGKQGLSESSPVNVPKRVTIATRYIRTISAIPLRAIVTCM